MTRKFAAIVLGAFCITGVLLLDGSTAEAAKGKRRPGAFPPAKAASTGRTGTEKKDMGAVIPGEVVERKVEKLTDKIDWLSSLDDAKALARRQNKPIFWLHALGELDGEC